LIVRPVVPWSAAVLVKSTHALPEKLPTQPRVASDAGIAPVPVSRPPLLPQLLITGLPVAGHDASSIWALSAQPSARSTPVEPSPGGEPSGGAGFSTLPQPAVSARTTSRRCMWEMLPDRACGGDTIGALPCRVPWCAAHQCLLSN